MKRVLLTIALFASAAIAEGGSQSESPVILWNNAFLQAVRHTRMAPPMVARAAAMVHTCENDAWAAYSKAFPRTSS